VNRHSFGVIPAICVIGAIGGPSENATVVVWGGEGHRIVCEIAWQRMTPAARAMVNSIRAADPDSGSSFPESCNWADRVRGTTHQYTNTYHYINVPAGSGGVDLARDCGDPEKRCVPWAIQHYAVVLADPRSSPIYRAEALKFLAHFIGDLHQPLHAGRPEDLGGNRIRADFFGMRGRNGDSLNLHAIWDSAILDRGHLTWPDSALALNAQITPREAAEWEKSTVLDWTNESYRGSEEVVYRLPEGKRIDEAYYRAGLALSRSALQRAGVRLAGVLNRIAEGTFSPGTLGVP
jgi:hypothetical protein